MINCQVYVPYPDTPCLHWGGLGGQCRHTWHTWSVWARPWFSARFHTTSSRTAPLPSARQTVSLIMSPTTTPDAGPSCNGAVYGHPWSSCDILSRRSAAGSEPIHSKLAFAWSYEVVRIPIWPLGSVLSTRSTPKGNHRNNYCQCRRRDWWRISCVLGVV